MDRATIGHDGNCHWPKVVYVPRRTSFTKTIKKYVDGGVPESPKRFVAALLYKPEPVRDKLIMSMGITGLN